MRHFVFITLGVLEVVIGGILIHFGFQLPGGGEVEESFDKAQHVTARTSTQVHLVRLQLCELRKPELQQLSADLTLQSRLVGETLAARTVNYDTLKTICEALKSVALGLDGIALSLDPKTLGQLGHSLEVVADYLDKKVVPGAAKTAGELEDATRLLQADTKRLGTLLDAFPLDLKGVSEIHGTLAHFSETIARIAATLDTSRLKTMKDGFDGLETSLSTGAAQVDKLSTYSYPVVMFHGLKPQVEMHSFWPDGTKIAEGMRKAASGAQAAGKEMDAMIEALPRVRTSFDDGQRIVNQTRDSLGLILKHRETLEPLLRDLPAHSAKMAEQLPKVGTDLAQVIRSTEQLTDAATALRETQKGLDESASRWPALNRSLSSSATLLRAAQLQLEVTLHNRDQYETAMRQMAILTRQFADMLPLFVKQLECSVGEQERTLGELGDSLDQVNEALPAYGHTACNLARTARLLVWLLSAVAGLHGIYLVGSVAREFHKQPATGAAS